MRKFILLGAAVLLSACTGMPGAAPAAPSSPVVGGYAAANANDETVRAAEALAVAEIYKRDPQRGLVEQVTREQQVVAGMNYRFTIKMTGVNSYRIVVFKPLPGQGEMTVTGYEKLAGN